MGWLLKFKTILNVLTLLLEDKIITKATAQLNMLFLHMVVYVSLRSKFNSFVVEIVEIVEIVIVHFLFVFIFFLIYSVILIGRSFLHSIVTVFAIPETPSHIPSHPIPLGCIF